MRKKEEERTKMIKIMRKILGLCSHDWDDWEFDSWDLSINNWRIKRCLKCGKKIREVWRGGSLSGGWHSDYFWDGVEEKGEWE